MSIKCYQCSSDEDPKGEDNCGAYEHFDQNKNIAVECMGEEALTPGTTTFQLVLIPLLFLNIFQVSNLKKVHVQFYHLQ